MKLKKLAAKPQLIKILIDDEETKTRYGDALEFWIYDRQDMDTFIKLASAENGDFGMIAELAKTMIRDEDGSAIVDSGFVLPMDVMMKAIQKVVDVLGKPLATISESPVTA